MDKINLAGKKISVLGAARSGKALAGFLTGRGARVLISDQKEAGELAPVMADLSGIPVEWETGGHTDRVFVGRDMVIISPGVSIRHPLLQRAMDAGVPVISEVELAYLFSRAPMIAITGTNGKSTTTTLVHDTLTSDGRKSYLAGNIGIPLVERVAQFGEDSWITAEISSFQLEAVDRFQPRVAALLNVTTDHIDRHGSFQEYLEAKARIFRRQGPGDWAILNADDAGVMSLSGGIGSRKLYFSRAGRVGEGAFFEDGFLKTVYRGEERVLFSWDMIPLKGVHNLENVLATVCVAMAVGVRMESVLRAVQGFKPLHYRMQYVATIGGVEFYNDSKGTNPDAVRASLVSFDSPVVLIAGGTDKGLDFSPLAENIVKYAYHAVLIGQSRHKIARALDDAGFGGYQVIDDMSLEGFRAAIKAAFVKAPPGGVVLLSPSCASFDMFQRAEHRGEVFDNFVLELKEDHEKAV